MIVICMILTSLVSDGGHLSGLAGLRLAGLVDGDHAELVLATFRQTLHLARVLVSRHLVGERIIILCLKPINN